MEKKERRFRILIAEDNEDDYLLARDALKECRPDVELCWVKDGEELMDYLLRQGAFQNAADAPLPDLLLLDLNMPRKNGREALKEIRSHPSLIHLPIVVLTTSHNQNDVVYSYDQGANSYIRKPIGFQPFVEIMGWICRYWFECATLPTSEEKPK